MIQSTNGKKMGDFFSVDKETEKTLALFFFEQRKLALSNMKKLKSNASRAREYLVAQSDYDALCVFELALGLQHEVQANNITERLRKNHAKTLQTIFSSKEVRYVKLARDLNRIFARETKARLFRPPPRQLKKFYEKLIT